MKPGACKRCGAPTKRGKDGIRRTFCGVSCVRSWSRERYSVVPYGKRR